MPKRTRFVACSCTHGDMADTGAVAKFRAFVDDYKPAIRVHLGDAVDLRWLRQGAGDDERRDDVDADFEAGCEFLRWYEPTHYLLGNHEYRLVKGAQSSWGALRRLCDDLLEQLREAAGKAQIAPYCKRNGVVRIGDLACVHGYSHGKNATERHANAYGNVIMGHTHSISRVPVEGVPPKEGRSIGCLCRLDLPYNAAILGALRHQHGFVYGETDGERTWVFQAESQDGAWNV